MCFWKMFTLFFCQRPLNLIDLRTFVAKFCREDLRTFSADFFGLKNGIRRLLCFLDVCQLEFCVMNINIIFVTMNTCKILLLFISGRYCFHISGKCYSAHHPLTSPPVIIIIIIILARSLLTLVISDRSSYSDSVLLEYIYTDTATCFVSSDRALYIITLWCATV